MFTTLVLIFLFCQCNADDMGDRECYIIKKNTGRKINILGMEGTTLDVFEKLLKKLFENIEARINPVIYIVKKIMELNFPKEYFSGGKNSTPEQKKGLCIFCKVVTKYSMNYTRRNKDIEGFKNILFLVCSVIIYLIDKEVCIGLVNLNIYTLAYVLLHGKELTAKQACAILMQKYGCYKDDRPDWSVYIPPGNSVELEFPNDEIESRQLKVIQITDLHMDSMYTPGATTSCGKPLCCQADQEQDVNGAGKWADYRDCDMPWHTMEHLLDDIAKNDKQISYLYLTGDIISHRVWDTSIANNTKEIRKIYRMLKTKLRKIRVFPVIGNHESHPLNLFAPLSVPKQYSTKWLYNLVAEEWSTWLPKSALDTIRLGGYYSVLVKPGFRIIVLNSNVCYTFNWWLLLDNYDTYDQLHWLALELQKAEKAKEMVHILSHQPPGESECLIPWARQFHKIVERFSHTITAHFNGHTHYDEIRIFYNTSNLSQAINVAYNGGSFTSFTNVNPNYRIYSISPQSFRVTNYEERIFHVPIANLFPNRTPEWRKLYSFKEAYGLKSLNLKHLNGLVERMTKEKKLLQDYYRFKVCDSEPGMMEVCDKECMLLNLCLIVTTVFDDNEKCEILKKEFELHNSV